MTTFTASRVQHGTISGYALHSERREVPCSECTSAKRQYDRERFRSHPTKSERNRQNARARSRALARLARLHPAQFDALMAQERATEGLA